MNPLETITGPQSQQTKFKIYAPNGDTKEVVAFLGIRAPEDHPELAELFLMYKDGTVEVLNKKVVVKNLETKRVCYNPRTAPELIGGRVFIGIYESRWLQENPHWPAILELWDHPVDGESINP